MKYFIYILLITLAINAKGQSDSIHIEYNTDTCIQSTVGEYDRILRHIIPNKEEVKTLYKIDVLQLAFKNPNFAIEKKIGKNRSLDLYFMADKLQSNYAYYDYHILTPVSPIYYGYIKADFRFYNNEKRLRKGKNTNGFSANYFVTGLTIKPVIYNTDDYKVGKDGMLFHTKKGQSPQSSYYGKEYTTFYQGKSGEHVTPSLIYLNVGYGFQRRLGNIGYLAAETKIGLGTSINFNHVYIPWEVSIRAGFALSSLKLKK